MKVFTYKNYIKCIHTLRLNAIFQLAEENANYNINRNKINNRHDKLIKNILKDEKEMRKRINTTIKETISVKNREWYLLYLIYIIQSIVFMARHL